MFLINYFTHRRNCLQKQNERQTEINKIRDRNGGSITFTSSDTAILNLPLDRLIRRVQRGDVHTSNVLRAVTKAAVATHERTNCLTEIMVDHMTAELKEGKIVPREENGWARPLAGVPVSVKDTVVVGGFDATVGFSQNVGQKFDQDGPMVRLLKDAGAIPFVKTNVPTTLLSFESSNDVWGRTTNPHNSEYTPGGSSGGEGALLSLGGSWVGIGSDVAGSVRLPAAWSGCSALRCSTGRWPRMGTVSSMAGQEGVASVFSPMGRTAADVRTFMAGVMAMRPWEYDSSVLPLPWDEEQVRKYAELKVSSESSTKDPIRVGVIWDDGVVRPTPACSRALMEVVNALRNDGVEVVNMTPPPDASPAYGLQLGACLLNSDACQTFGQKLNRWETNDPGARQMLRWARTPWLIRWLYVAWVRHVRGDELWASLLESFHPRSVAQQWELVAKRDKFRQRWHDWWSECPSPSRAWWTGRVDVLLTVPNATPALPHGAMHDGFSACGYTFLFNLLDYAAGVVPVSKVDARRDLLVYAGEPEPEDRPAGWFPKWVRPTNSVAKGVYGHYDSEKMAGLPLAVQVVGRRWEEERVLGMMVRIERLMGYARTNVWDKPVTVSSQPASAVPSVPSTAATPTAVSPSAGLAGGSVHSETGDSTRAVADDGGQESKQDKPAKGSKRAAKPSGRTKQTKSKGSSLFGLGK